MKRTRLDTLPSDIPNELLSAIRGAPVFDSSCSPEARVYYIDRGSGCFLKRAPVGTLRREAVMTEYFNKKGLAPEVLNYVSRESDWLLTVRAPGEDLTHRDYLSDPKRLATVMGEELRSLHETDFDGCPAPLRLTEYLACAEENYRTGNYDKSAFPDSFGYTSADEAYATLTEGKGLLVPDTLIHGDYCLPNIILNGWNNRTFIDLGNGGVADRHIDLFWGAWTLWFNLKTNEHRDRFFDAYGRDKVDPYLLRVIAAAEVFG